MYNILVIAMTNLKLDHADETSKVKGPIRCHKCQLMCRDAEHYLSHKCEPKLSSACMVFPLPASREPR